MCTRYDHDLLRDDPQRLAVETVPIQPQLNDDGSVLFHLRNCLCGSTIAVEPSVESMVPASSVRGSGDLGRSTGSDHVLHDRVLPVRLELDER